jgi:hypothetical protein
MWAICVRFHGSFHACPLFTPCSNDYFRLCVSEYLADLVLDILAKREITLMSKVLRERCMLAV